MGDADGSNRLRGAESSIEWRHEGFGVKKRALRPGGAVPGEPALCADGLAAGGGSGNGRFDNEAIRGFEGENNSDEDESPGKHGEGGSGFLKAQEDCWPCGENCRDACRQGGKSSADCTYQAGLCCFNRTASDGTAVGKSSYSRCLLGCNEVCARPHRRGGRSSLPGVGTRLSAG